MRIIDLSHKIENNMTVFPNDLPPSVEACTTIEKDGFRSCALTLTSHTGTHIDAPAHLFCNGRFLDDFPCDTFCGVGSVVDVRHCLGRRIEPSDIINVEDTAASSHVDFLLFFTGWGEKWNSEDYLTNFPTLSPAAAIFLTEMNLKGVGFDTISPDAVDSPSCEIHRILLGADVLIIENLKNLDKLGLKQFFYQRFHCRLQSRTAHL